MQDGIHGMLPREQMCEGARKYWDFYTMKPGAGFVQREFGYYCLDKWRREEGLPEDADLDKLFGFDPVGFTVLYGLGGCDAGFEPFFEEKVLEDRGDYELVQDRAGRAVLCFKGRRNGFMPEYVAHPVTDMRSWEEKCRWRMDPTTPARIADMDRNLAEVEKQARMGMCVKQKCVGGYMYLRSLMGPEDLLYKFYDDPELIHACMQQWFELADAVTAYYQKRVCIDILALDEDICYKNGSLISPDMIREFLLPYYQQLTTNMRARQIDKARPVGVELDTDGFSDVVIDLYKPIGMTVLAPFEAAAGCDVVRTACEYPDLRITGGVDKMVLAQSTDAIDRMVDRIFPVMQKRGGYIPTCDHGVPEEVSLKNYLHYRKRCLEFA